MTKQQQLSQLIKAMHMQNRRGNLQEAKEMEREIVLLQIEIQEEKKPKTLEDLQKEHAAAGAAYRATLAAKEQTIEAK